MPHTSEVESHFGPVVFVDSLMDDKYAGVQVDTVRMGENLQRDFPDLKQSDWDRVAVLMTKAGHNGFGGACVDLLGLNISKVARRMVAVRYSKAQSRHISYEDLRQWGEDYDILVMVNLAAKVKLSRSIAQGVDLTPSYILSHELKHAADKLYENRIYKPEGALSARKKQIRHGLGHMAAAGVGLGTIGIGGSAMFLGLSLRSLDTVGVGAAMIYEGVAITAAPILSMHFFKNMDNEKFGLEEPAQPYGEGEGPANAYALAMAESWQSAVET